MRPTLAALLLSAGVLAGCKVGPNYQRPNTISPEKWTSRQDADTTTTVDLSLITWWKSFNDPALDSLTEVALVNNFDLKIAMLRLKQAREQKKIARASALPTLDANTSYARSLGSQDTEGRRQRPGLPIRDAQADLYQGGFDAAWEADIWGRVARSVEAAKADLESSEETLRDVRVTLLAEVARTYFEMRGLQRQLAVVKKNTQSQKESFDLTSKRFTAGLDSGLDSARAEAQVAQTESRVPTLEAGIERRKYELAILLGSTPDALTTKFSELSLDVTQSPIPAGIAVGIPGDLLRRRPDVRAAERDIAAATARIGVAKAELFPKLTLNGSVGLATSDFSTLSTGSSRFWSFGPAVTLPLFNGGRLRANKRLFQAREQEAIATYERTVITAYAETEIALSNFAREQTRNGHLRRAVQANTRAVDLATKLFQQGLTDFLSVLDTERRLLEAEDSLADSDSLLATNLVSIYKTLGGGWDPAAQSEITKMESKNTPK